MSVFYRWTGITLFSLVFTTQLTGMAFINKEQAEKHPGFSHQGEYTGQVILGDGDTAEVGLQVAIYAQNEVRARAYHGGLPGQEEFSGESGQALSGKTDGERLELTGDGPFSFHSNVDGFTVLNKNGEKRGHLKRIHRKSRTSGLKAPREGKVLFDGSNLSYWQNASISSKGLLKPGASTSEKYGDMRLHLEAKIGFIPESEGQHRGNSGIYIQNRYEVQILDSFAMKATPDGNSSLYLVSTPMKNMSFPPLSWQAYDVFFRAPRFDSDGQKIENARVTVYLNGALVQDDVELKKGTGSRGRLEEVSRGMLVLQAKTHTGPVRFRNVWLVEESYSPPGTRFLGK